MCIDECGEKIYSDCELALPFHSVYQEGEPNWHIFLKLMTQYKLPDIHRLEIRYMDEILNESLDEVNYFFKHSFWNNLQYLLLSGGNWQDITPFHEGLSQALQKVHKQVFLIQFKIEHPSLSMILENWAQVKELTFWFWEFGEMPISEFKIDESLDFQIENLNLFKSWQESDTRFLNDEKLDILIEVMSKTKLKSSLRHVAFDEQDYEAEDKQLIFKKFGFKLSVFLDEDLPSPAKTRTSNDFKELLTQ